MRGGSILWRRLDHAGHEACRLTRASRGWRLSGTAVFEHESEACRLDYAVTTDARWHTASASVEAWIGARSIRREIVVVGRHRWRMNGKPQAALDGCIDVDLNFSPSTNVLPIRRLDLAVGEEASVRAAWLRFPTFTLEPLEQVYRRTGPLTWRYESAGGRFVRDLDVDENGFVTRYPGIWERETGAD